MKLKPKKKKNKKKSAFALPQVDYEDLVTQQYIEADVEEAESALERAQVFLDRKVSCKEDEKTLDGILKGLRREDGLCFYHSKERAHGAFDCCGLNTIGYLLSVCLNK